MNQITSKAYFAATSFIKTTIIKVFHGKNFTCGKLPYFKGNIDIDLANGAICKLGNRFKMMAGGGGLVLEIMLC